MALTAGCAGLPEIQEPSQVFADHELLDVTEPADRPAELPAVGDLEGLHRLELGQALAGINVADLPPAVRDLLEELSELCVTARCYTTEPVTEDPELAAFERLEVAALTEYLDKARHNTELADALARTLNLRKHEINALIRIGKLQEVQAQMLVEQARFHRGQATSEWWSARITALVALLALGLGN